MKFIDQATKRYPQLNDDCFKVIRFYVLKGEGTRNDLTEHTGMSVQSASGRMSDVADTGVIYKTGKTVNRQAVYKIENDPARWGYHANQRRNSKRAVRVIGLLEEFGNEMPETLRKELRVFGAQTLLV